MIVMEMSVPVVRLSCKPQQAQHRSTFQYIGVNSVQIRLNMGKKKALSATQAKQKAAKKSKAEKKGEKRDTKKNKVERDDEEDLDAILEQACADIALEGNISLICLLSWLGSGRPSTRSTTRRWRVRRRNERTPLSHLVRQETICGTHFRWMWR